MPELPEIEVYRRHLAALCTGLTVVQAEIGRERSLNVPGAQFAETVQGAALTEFGRAGKMLLCRLSRGGFLVNHLMLGGGIFCGTTAERPDRNFQAILHLSDGRALYWFGLRLGWLHLVDEAGLREHIAALGTDPLSPEFTQARLDEILDGRRSALKACLVDQRFFPGIGNCYSDEICWLARVHPLRPAGTLLPPERDSLLTAIRATLSQALALGGYTETPFHTGDRFTGGYLPHLKVYDREHEPCPRCRTPIAFERAGGRKVFHCPSCQPIAQPTFYAEPTHPLHPSLMP